MPNLKKLHFLWMLWPAFSCGQPNTRTTAQPALEGDVPVALVVAPRVPLKRLVDSLHVHADSLRFHVVKSRRVFHVIANGDTLCTYPCVLGERPEGDKQMQGDRRTPEGVFGFRSKRMHDKWHAFVWVDYPNAESWRRFRERQRKGIVPTGADIGGEIGIHGVPEGMDHWIVQGVDWTWGCIALRNTDLDEIYPHIRPGRTTITIVP
jgi:murein L,D-transpeptidase YafK